MNSRIPLVVLLAAVTAACGDGPVEPEADAFVASADAGALSDTPTPSPDTGPPDGDGDGVPTSGDCDDSNPAVGMTGERPCSTACGMGTEACTAGTWGMCSASTDCLCTMPGATRAADCGNCGSQMETCTGGMWSPTSACLGQGCMPGAVEVEMGSQCFERQRICAADCTWSEWEVTRPAGVCSSGRCEDGMECNDDCVWVPSGRC